MRTYGFDLVADRFGASSLRTRHIEGKKCARCRDGLTRFSTGFRVHAFPFEPSSEFWN